MKYRTATVIVGPTTSGKTDVAFALARHMGMGEIVNLDKIECYRHFPISTGVADTLKEKDIKKHLYELLEPDQEPTQSETYIRLVRDTCAQILLNGGLPIIEGGSTTYFPTLFEANTKTEFCKPIVGLRPPRGFDLRSKVVARVNIAIQSGLIDEIREGLKSYQNTFLMNDSMVIAPLVRYINGKINLEKAKTEIVNQFLNYAHKQMKLFIQHHGIIWIEHNPAYLPQTVEKIQTLIVKHCACA